MPVTVVGCPTTSFGESQRQDNASLAALPGLQRTTVVTYGTVTEVHSSNVLVKALDRGSSPIANGQWIPLTHSAQEIRERFGKLRKGFAIMVSHTVPDGTSAIGTIIGGEGESVAGVQLDNSVKKSTFAIFSPGCSSLG